MAQWLLKTEPGAYSWDDLVREKKTMWSGITNATALIHIRSMKKGDPVLIYHTGDEKAVVGIGTVASNPYPDPTARDERIVVVDVKSGAKLPRPVTLGEMKSDPAFAGFDLLRISRLSVVPVPDPIWRRIEELAARPPDAGARPPKNKEARRR